MQHPVLGSFPSVVRRGMPPHAPDLYCSQTKYLCTATVLQRCIAFQCCLGLKLRNSQSPRTDTPILLQLTRQTNPRCPVDVDLPGGMRQDPICTTVGLKAGAEKARMRPDMMILPSTSDVKGLILERGRAGPRESSR